MVPIVITCTRLKFNYMYTSVELTISFHVYFIVLGLISIFLHVGRVQISCGLLPTRIFLKIPCKTIAVKRGRFSIIYKKVIWIYYAIHFEK